MAGKGTIGTGRGGVLLRPQLLFGHDGLGEELQVHDETEEWVRQTFRWARVGRARASFALLLL